MELKNKPVKIWSCISWDSELRIIVLVRESSNIVVSQPVSLERACRQTAQSEFEAVVRQSPLV
jgi:hypothetical protein